MKPIQWFTSQSTGVKILVALGAIIFGLIAVAVLVLIIFAIIGTFVLNLGPETSVPVLPALSALGHAGTAHVALPTV